MCISGISHQRPAGTLQYTATHWNKLQHNTLQHAATHTFNIHTFNVQQAVLESNHAPLSTNTVQHSGKRCNSLHYTATHYTTQQHTTLHSNTHRFKICIPSTSNRLLQSQPTLRHPRRRQTTREDADSVPLYCYCSQPQFGWYCRPW